MPTEEELAGKVGKLREHFLSVYKDTISDGESYYPRDVQKVREDNSLVQCYMRSFSENLDLEAPAKQIDTVLRWRKTFGILDITDDSLPRELLDKRYLYWNGVDKKGYKVLILIVAKHKKNTMMQDTMKHIAHTFEQHHSENPGERIVFVFDFTGAGITNVDIDIVKFIITALSNYFPSLLSKILLFETPFLLRATIALIRKMLSKEQNEVIHVVKKQDLQEHIDADQLEDRMQKK